MQICKGKFYFRPWSSWLASEAYLAVSEAFLAASEGFQAAFEALTHASEALGAASETLSVYTAPEAPSIAFEGIPSSLCHCPLSCSHKIQLYETSGAEETM